MLISWFRVDFGTKNDIGEGSKVIFETKKYQKLHVFFGRSMQTMQSGYAFRLYIQAMHAGYSFRLFIQTIHSSYPFRLCSQPIHSGYAFWSFCQTATAVQFRITFFLVPLWRNSLEIRSELPPSWGVASLTEFPQNSVRAATPSGGGMSLTYRLPLRRGGSSDGIFWKFRQRRHPPRGWQLRPNFQRIPP